LGFCTNIAFGQLFSSPANHDYLSPIFSMLLTRLPLRESSAISEAIAPVFSFTLAALVGHLARGLSAAAAISKTGARGTSDSPLPSMVIWRALVLSRSCENYKDAFSFGMGTDILARRWSYMNSLETREIVIPACTSHAALSCRIASLAIVSSCKQSLHGR
jgi:hypothetical protein